MSSTVLSWPQSWISSYLHHNLSLTYKLKSRATSQAYCNWINIYSFLRQMLVMYSCLWVKSTEYLGVSGCSGSLNISILLLRSQSLMTNWWVTNRGIWAFVVAGVLYLTCVHCTGTEWCSSCVLYSSQHLTLTLTLTLNEPPKLTLILNLTTKYTLLPPPKKQQQQTNKQQEAVPLWGTTFRSGALTVSRCPCNTCSSLADFYPLLKSYQRAIWNIWSHFRSTIT